MKKLGFFFCVMLAIQAASCSKKSDTTSSQPAPVAGDSKTAKPECTDGRQPQILEGTCSGVWKALVDKSGKKSCVFSFGPPISCPTGTKSTTYEAVCYGDSVKDGFTPTTPQDCEAHFGKSPGPAPYRLACCPL